MCTANMHMYINQKSHKSNLRLEKRSQFETRELNLKQKKASPIREAILNILFNFISFLATPARGIILHRMFCIHRPFFLMRHQVKTFLKPSLYLLIL